MKRLVDPFSRRHLTLSESDSRYSQSGQALVTHQGGRGRGRTLWVSSLTPVCAAFSLSYPETLQATNTQSICLFPHRQNIYYWWNSKKTKLTKDTNLFPNSGKLVPGPSFWDGTSTSEVVWSSMKMSILAKPKVIWLTLFSLVFESHF